MEGVSSEDFIAYSKSLLDSLGNQTKKSDEIISELKKLNQFLSDSEKKQVEKEKQEQEKEKEKKESGEQTTEEKILNNFESFLKVNEERNKRIDDVMSQILEELKVDNTTSVESQKKLENLVSMQEVQVKSSKEQTDIFITYGIILVPTCLFLFFMYKFFRQFI